MAWYSSWRRKARPAPAPAAGARAAGDNAALSAAAGALAGGRLTLDRTDHGLGGLQVVLPPPDPLSDWRTLKLDSRTLDRVSPNQLMAYLLDLSPDVSKGQWDWSRMVNAGWSAKAYAPGSDGTAVDTRAQAALDAFLGRLKARYKSVDVPVNRLFMGALARGALFSEVVLDPTGHQAIDLVVPDAAVVRFKEVDDPVYGPVHVPGQMQGWQWVPYNRPTVGYVPVDPAPGSPYGRPLLSPAVFSGLFMLSILHDLRRVIAQQGMPRPDIVIELEKLAVPQDALPVASPAYYAWLGKIGQQVAAAYAALESDSAYVHTSATTLNRPVGAVDGDSLAGLGAVIEAVERQLVRALKTTPFMMGMSQSTTETQANRQWEAYLQGIKSVQHLAESLLEDNCQVALRAEGIIARVEWRFAENRASEEMRDEQVRQLKLANAREGYAAGHLSQDESAQYAWGRDTADQPEPRDSAIAAPAPGTQQNPEPGTARSMGQRAKLVPLGAGDGFAPLVALAPLSDDEKAALAGVWDRSQATDKYKGMLDAALEGGDE